MIHINYLENHFGNRCMDMTSGLKLRKSVNMP
jgi:hypothetical protein